MLTMKLDHAACSVMLAHYLTKIRNKTVFFKTWGRRVEQRAKGNARAMGGKSLWRTIADDTTLSAVSDSGAKVECRNPIGAHKETGGPILAKNRACLTIPIDAFARGKTVMEMRLDGIQLFHPKGTNVLGYSKGKKGRFVALFALRKATKPQRRFPWWPTAKWALDAGIEEAAYHVEKGR